MTAKEIAQLIASPEKCSASDFVEIEKFAAKYPYAQTFPILLLQHLGKTKSLEFEEQLNKYAYKISDRAQLYFLINEGVKSEAKVTSEPVQTIVEKAEEIIEQEAELTIVPNESEPTKVAEIQLDEVSDIVEEKLEIAPVEVEPSEPENRSDVDINPDEDMLDFKVVEVEEMTFEPVTISFDDDEIKALELEEPVAFESEVVIEEEPEIILAVPEEKEIDPIAEAVQETIEKTIEEAITPDFVPEIEPSIIEEKEEIEFESHVPEETSKHDQHHDHPPVEEEITEIEAVHETEVKSIEFFDPTADIFVQEIETEEEHVSPSSFEEESKAISLDIMPSEVDETDEVTSNAIAAGYQITEIEEPTEEILAEENVPVEEEKETQEVVQEFEDKVAADRRSFTDWLKVSATTQSPEYQVKQQRTVDIVDRFIKDDPKITRISKTEEPAKKVAEFFKVATIAKESLNEEVMPVSETLALIYEQQGNFGKAIDAYQQLLLLNPEKKSFFANQIKKLKKKIKN